MMIMSRLMIMTYPWTASAMIADRVTFSTLPDSHLVPSIIKLVMAIMKRVRQLSLEVQAELNAQPQDTLRGSQGGLRDWGVSPKLFHLCHAGYDVLIINKMMRM